MLETATRYRCRTCSTTRCVPESPEDHPHTISMGCPDCETIRTFEAVGGGAMIESLTFATVFALGFALLLAFVLLLIWAEGERGPKY